MYRVSTVYRIYISSLQIEISVWVYSVYVVYLVVFIGADLFVGRGRVDGLCVGLLLCWLTIGHEEDADNDDDGNDDGEKDDTKNDDDDDADTRVPSSYISYHYNTQQALGAQWRCKGLFFLARRWVMIMIASR